MKKFTILTIDDEENIRNGLTDNFELEGYNVAQASNGKTGLDIISKGGIDLVITDLRMDGISGEEVVRKVATDFPGIPVIVLTGHGSIDDATAAIKAGAFDILDNDWASKICPNEPRKAIMAYYYVTHIKPFDVYSEEIGLILFKDVLAHNDFEDISTLIDIEMILSENEEAFNNILNEVRKTNDITYLVAYLNPVLDDIINELNNQISKVKTLEIKNEYYEVPHNNVRNKEQYLVQNNVESFSRQTNSQVDFELNVSLPKVPIGLDEEDAAKIEEHLLEIFPTLKRGQAYFYARHCTIGKYYTISQYKKLLDVAYETARTSMDNLVDLGFYRKEKLNNKFIYTPLPRR